MLNCPGTRALFSAYLESSLQTREREKVEDHLARCGGCQEDFRLFSLTVQALGSLPERPAPGDLRRRVQAQLAQDQVEARLWSEARSPIESVNVGEASRRSRRMAIRFPSFVLPRRGIAWAYATAGLMATVLVIVLATHHGDRHEVTTSLTKGYRLGGPSAPHVAVRPTGNGEPEPGIPLRKKAPLVAKRLQAKPSPVRVAALPPAKQSAVVPPGAPAISPPAATVAAPPVAQARPVPAALSEGTVKAPVSPAAPAMTADERGEKIEVVIPAKPESLGGGGGRGGGLGGGAEPTTASPGSGSPSRPEEKPLPRAAPGPARPRVVAAETLEQQPEIKVMTTEEKERLGARQAAGVTSGAKLDRAYSAAKEEAHAKVVAGRALTGPSLGIECAAKVRIGESFRATVVLRPTAAVKEAVLSVLAPQGVSVKTGKLKAGTTSQQVWSGELRVGETLRIPVEMKGTAAGKHRIQFALSAAGIETKVMGEATVEVTE